MITTKQRAYLKSLSQNMQPIFQIGKGGITEEICKQLANALEARELIKVSVLDTCDAPIKLVAECIQEAIQCEVVSVIGKKIVFYKESINKKRIDLNV